MTKRIGLGAGQGKGYKNIVGTDPKIHSDSSKGRKQPQRVNVDAMIKQAELKGKNIGSKESDSTEPQFFDVDELTKPTKLVSSVEDIGAKTKKEAFVKKTLSAGKQGIEFAKQQLAKIKEKNKEKKIKTLEEIDHPLSRKLKAQEERVDELKKEIELNEEPEREQKLFDELSQEQDQLRKIQEKATELDLTQLSDAELKTLAIRHPEDESFLSGLFGSGEDKYTAELLKRIQKKKELEQKLSEARKTSPKKKEPGFFEDFFSF